MRADVLIYHLAVDQFADFGGGGGGVLTQIPPLADRL